MRRLWLVIVCVAGLLAVAASVAAAHPEPGDVDGDGVRDELDNCPHTRNADQLNTDGLGPGDRCDTDADEDGIPNPLPYLDPRGPGDDNCPVNHNPGQEPSEDPRFGAACYLDSDGDGVPDPLDNCPRPGEANPGQADYDYDRTGDVCDPDDDEDGEFDAVDNCQFTYNYDQADADRDGIGSACDGSESLGEVGGSGGSGGGAANPSDRSAPTLRLRLARTQRLAALGAGLAVKVRCSEGCALQARLRVSRPTARRLGIGSRKTTVAQGSAALAGRGTTYVFLRFKRGMTRRLGRRTVRAQLTLTVTDEAGNKRTRDRVLRLRP
jgi:Thrombospondin type 3 repeat